MCDKYGRYFAVIKAASMGNKKVKNIVNGCESRVGENAKNDKNQEKEM